MMGASEGMTKAAVLFAKIVLSIWEALSRVWAKLAPVRIKFNFVWLKIEMLLDPIWRRIEPIYRRIGGVGRKVESSLEVSRKGSALFFGFIFVMLIAAMAAVTVPLTLYAVSVHLRGLIVLLFFLILLMAIMGLSYVAINEFDKSNHLFRLASSVIIIPFIFSLIPPIAFAIPFVLLFLVFFGLMVAAIAEGCLDPDAFDFSVYMGTTDKRPAEYHHTITEQDARYKQSSVALDRVVKKTKAKKGEEMEIIPDHVDFKTEEDLEFEAEVETEFEPDEEMEFEAEVETEFEPDEEMEFEAEEETEFEPDEEMEFEEEEDEAIDFEPEGVIFGDEEEEIHVQHDEDFEIKDIDDETIEKTVKDYEAGEQKKEMPEEEFDI